MEKPLSPQLIRDFDAMAINTCEVPGYFLMESAAHSLLEWVTRSFSRQIPFGVRVLVGKGNNGGDGLALGRLLAARGASVRYYLVYEPDPTTPQSGSVRNFRLIVNQILSKYHTAKDSLQQILDSPERFEGLWIDALLGTGFQGSLRAPMDQFIERLNARGETVASIDIPSGLNGETGEPSPVAVRARGTGTLGAQKIGLSKGCARSHSGPVTVLPIGWPDAVLRDLAEA